MSSTWMMPNCEPPGIGHDHARSSARSRVGPAETRCATAGSTAESRKSPRLSDDAEAIVFTDREAILAKFAGELDSVRAALDYLLVNFASIEPQGPQAYADQMTVDHPELGPTTLFADAVTAVGTFGGRLTTRSSTSPPGQVVTDPFGV